MTSTIPAPSSMQDGPDGLTEMATLHGISPSTFLRMLIDNSAGVTRGARFIDSAKEMQPEVDHV